MPASNPDSIPSTTPQSPSKSLWPLGIIATIVLFTSINMVMVSIAYRNPSVPAAKDHWAESLAFDEEYNLRVASQKLGWRAEIKPCKAAAALTHPNAVNKEPSNQLDGSAKLPGDNCALQIQVFDRQNQEVSGLVGTVSVRRGDSAQFDREATLRAATGGYIADLQLGRPGYYDLKLKLQQGENPWQNQRRLWLGPHL